jgi:hypothetical protein
MSAQDLTDKQIAEIIGASSAVPVEGLPAQGPLDLLALRREVQERLQSGGGRPTDPTWTITRSIRFRPEHWHRLEKLAERISGPSRRVGPGQLAAILVERALRQIDRT